MRFNFIVAPHASVFASLPSGAFSGTIVSATYYENKTLSYKQVIFTLRGASTWA
jgi:hypothetical protein